MSIKLEQVLEASGRTLKGGSISQVLGRKTELRYFNRENLMWKTSHKSDGRAEKAIRGQWSNTKLPMAGNRYCSHSQRDKGRRWWNQSWGSLERDGTCLMCYTKQREKREVPWFSYFSPFNLQSLSPQWSILIEISCQRACKMQFAAVRVLQYRAKQGKGREQIWGQINR